MHTIFYLQLVSWVPGGGRSQQSVELHGQSGTTVLECVTHENSVQSKRGATTVFGQNVIREQLYFCAAPQGFWTDLGSRFIYVDLVWVVPHLHV